MREEVQEGTVMPLADTLSASSNDYEPRIMVKYKYNNRYALWLYEPKDWDGSNPYYNDHWDIIAWAYTREERYALAATVEYHTQLTKEIENANN